MRVDCAFCMYIFVSFFRWAGRLLRFQRLRFRQLSMLPRAKVCLNGKFGMLKGSLWIHIVIWLSLWCCEPNLKQQTFVWKLAIFSTFVLTPSPLNRQSLLINLKVFCRRSLTQNMVLQLLKNFKVELNFGWVHLHKSIFWLFANRLH